MHSIAHVKMATHVPATYIYIIHTHTHTACMQPSTLIVVWRWQLHRETVVHVPLSCRHRYRRHVAVTCKSWPGRALSSLHMFKNSKKKLAIVWQRHMCTYASTALLLVMAHFFCSVVESGDGTLLFEVMIKWLCWQERKMKFSKRHVTSQYQAEFLPFAA